MSLGERDDGTGQIVIVNNEVSRHIDQLTELFGEDHLRWSLALRPKVPRPGQ